VIPGQQNNCTIEFVMITQIISSSFMLTSRENRVKSALQPDESESERELILCGSIAVLISSLEDPLLKYSKHYEAAKTSD
jgi:hypothetical protein